jgi:hypothetical protein
MTACTGGTGGKTAFTITHPWDVSSPSDRTRTATRDGTRSVILQKVPTRGYRAIRREAQTLRDAEIQVRQPPTFCVRKPIRNEKNVHPPYR